MSAPIATPAPISTRPAVRHLAANDLRRFRVLLAAIVGLELLRDGYAEWYLHLAPAVLSRGVGDGGGEVETLLFDAVIWLLSWLLTAIVVQGDHPSDDCGFWRTRPLAPHAVALAKLAVFALVFVAVPVLANAIRLAAYGAPMSAQAAAAIQIGVGAGTAVVPAWTLAIATRTLPRFLATAFALLAAAYVFAMVSAVPGPPGQFAFSTGVRISLGDWTNSTRLGWLTAAGLTALLLAAIVAYYRVRRPWAAAGVIVGVVVLTNVLPAAVDVRPAPPELAALVAKPLRPTDGLWLGPDGGASRFVSGRLALPSLPLDVSAGVFVDRARIVVDGRDVALSGFQQCCLGLGPEAVALSRPKTPADGEGWSEELAYVRASELAALLTKPVTLDATATLVFQRHRLVASLPLAPGAAFAGNGYLVELLAVGTHDPAVIEMRLARFPHLRRDAHPKLAFFVSDPTRRHVFPVSTAFVNSVQPAARPVRQAIQGRRWSRRYKVQLLGGYPLGDVRRLLIVQSHHAGEASARIVAGGAPLRTRAQPQ
jgi:hypothetical protein